MCKQTISSVGKNKGKGIFRGWTNRVKFASNSVTRIYFFCKNDDKINTIPTEYPWVPSSFKDMNERLGKFKDKSVCDYIWLWDDKRGNENGIDLTTTSEDGVPEDWKYFEVTHNS